MEIIWHGHSCFRLTERGLASVVTDPYDNQAVGYEPLKLRADIVTVSHAMPGHNYAAGVKGYTRLINGPGEYEIGRVFITGIQTNGPARRNPDEPRNRLYMFDYEGVTVAHLGNLSRVPSQTEIEALETVDVLLVPVGGNGDDEHAVRAFEVNAVDYLLKPASPERLSAALRRARERLQARRPLPMARLVSEARPGPRRLDRILVRQGAQVHVLPVGDIDYVQAQDD